MFSDKPQDDSKEKQIEKKSTEKIITTANWYNKTLERNKW
jgi:hypothetical protein